MCMQAMHAVMYASVRNPAQTVIQLCHDLNVSWLSDGGHEITFDHKVLPTPAGETWWKVESRPLTVIWHLGHSRATVRSQSGHSRVTVGSQSGHGFLHKTHKMDGSRWAY